MKISIIIRCLNEEKHIGKLLSRIMAQQYKQVEIIVVDSGSTDATLSIAERFPTKIIHIKPEDFSFGYALNVGCEAASGDILLFASAHVYPLYNDWLDLMLTPFRQSEKVALTYGQQRGNEITRYAEHQIFAKWFPNESTLNQKHPFCNNANCAIRRTLWKAYPFDETLTGLEDLAWAKNIQELGWQIAYQAKATIVHLHEESWKSVFNRYRREALALRLIMKHEKFNFITCLTLLLRNLSSDYANARRDRVLLKNLYPIFLFRLMQFWGTYKGYKQSYLMDNQVRERFYYPKGYGKTPSAEPDEHRTIDYSDIHPETPPIKPEQWAN
ncbi:MAG: glycosyltransferase family 2 protein [Phaeodactylibacter sp.]|nr:glycosyltransferase family 2 protein [Phaeodactylibacter sp.]